MNKVIIAYVLALHHGYIRFFEKYDADIVLIDSNEFPELKEKGIFMERNLSALPVLKANWALKGIFNKRNVTILEKQDIAMYSNAFAEIIFPDEAISRHVATFFPQEKVSFDSIFLRAEQLNVKKAQNVDADVVEVDDEKLAALMGEAIKEASLSGDFWRHVGCLIVAEDGKKIRSYNHHLPDPQTPYVFGDYRSSFNQGEDIHITTAMHAEASAIAEAARQGIKLEGATLFTTTFPCPLCAKYVAEAGIETVYFLTGYSLVDAQKILESRGVKLFRLKSKEVV